MTRPLDLDRVFALDAEALRRARENARIMHPTDIRAAGAEVEEAVRNYLKRMLPSGYRVTSGHLIDSNRVVSPQIDVIITDNLGLSSLLTSSDGTEYIPVTSVYALGEIRSTYYHSNSPLDRMYNVLQTVAAMNRPLVENTSYEGLKDSTLMIDIVRPCKQKFHNNLFAFIFCVDGGDFEFERVQDLLVSADASHIPAMTILLDRGVVSYARRDAINSTGFTRYPNEVAGSDYDWSFVQGADTETGSAAGSHLATLYGALISHLSESHLEPPDAYSYLGQSMIFSRSSRRWART